jgi:tetratricopeptide (TPR) repeat protein
LKSPTAVLCILICAFVSPSFACENGAENQAYKHYDTARLYVPVGSEDQREREAWDTALPRLEEALKICPDHWPSLEMKGRWLVRSGDYPKAEELYRTIYDAADRWDGVREFFRADVLQYYARVLAHQNKPAEAIRIYEELIPSPAADSDNGVRPEQLVDAYAHLAVLYEQQGNPEDASYYAEQALAIDPKNIQIWLRLARLYQGRDMPGKAKEASAKVAELSEDPKILFELGRVALDEKDFDTAEGIFEKCIEKGYANGAAWFNLGWARQSLKDWAGALEAYRGAWDRNYRTLNTRLVLISLYTSNQVNDGLPEAEVEKNRSHAQTLAPDSLVFLPQETPLKPDEKRDLDGIRLYSAGMIGNEGKRFLDKALDPSTPEDEQRSLFREGKARYEDAKARLRLIQHAYWTETAGKKITFLDDDLKHREGKRDSLEANGYTAR